jgi:hypothetical protein
LGKKGKGETMNIGLIGPGEIGSVIVRKLRDAGRPVKTWGPIDGRGHEMFGWPMEEEAKLEYDRPIAMLLTVFQPRRTVQKHDARQS